MKRILAGLFVVMCLLPAMVFAAPPASVRASYEMYRNNILFARVHETFTAEKGNYRIESSASPDGLLALLNKDRITRVSKGAITAEGLQPASFEEKRISGDKEKIRSARFDWGNHQLTLNFDEKTETAALEQGTQDWLSLFYQFLFRGPEKDTVKAIVTDGRRVESYLYHFADEMNISTTAGKFKTLHYIHSDDKGGRKTQIWLAKQHSFFPVRLVQEEGGNVIEQRLVALDFN